MSDCTNPCQPKSTRCKCGNIKIFRKGSVEFTIGDKKITVHCTPHFYCDRCDSRYYASGSRIDHFIKEAFKNDLNEIAYEEAEREYEMVTIPESIMIDELIKFDDDSPDGVFAVPASTDEPKVKVRALLEYCERVGKKLSELSTEELEPFLDRSPKRLCEDG